MEMGKLMLDINRPDAALHAFENVLRFDRAFPGRAGNAGMRADWCSVSMFSLLCVLVVAVSTFSMLCVPSPSLVVLAPRRSKIRTLACGSLVRQSDGHACGESSRILSPCIIY